MFVAMDSGTVNQYEFVPQAILKRSPAFFAGQGIRSESGLDDLNAYQVAELCLGDLPFMSMRHDGTPADETEVRLPDSVSLDRVANAVGRILAAFLLPADAIGWIRQRADTPF